MPRVVFINPSLTPVTVKLAEDWPAGMTTVGGTEASLVLLLTKAIVSGALSSPPVRVTVPVVVSVPVIVLAARLTASVGPTLPVIVRTVSTVVLAIGLLKLG